MIFGTRAADLLGAMRDLRATSLIWFCVSIFSIFSMQKLTAKETEDRPNFVLILGEGAGWSSTSVRMDDRVAASQGVGVSTPNLERLAARGVRFSDGYAASPRCTPSRAALFTGRSPAALHMTFVGDGKRGETVGETRRVNTPRAVLELPGSETTIAEHLKREGYATAHFGKWHVGRERPERHGFDESDGPTSNGGPDNVANPNPEQALGMTTRGIAFMEKQVKLGVPFYLQLSHYPSQPERGGEGKGRATVGAKDEMRVVDETIGQVLDAVERLGLTGRTYVIYTTDHGTPGRNVPLRGGKGTVSEGGMRVPFMIAGPGVRAGACSHVRVLAVDLFPTLSELAGVRTPLPEGIEGGSLVSLLRDGKVQTVDRRWEEFVAHFPHYDKDPDGPASAIWLGEYKLVRLYATGVRRLFRLTTDAAESRDLAREMPGKVEEMDRRLTKYLSVVKAQEPTLNTNVQPSETFTERRGGRGGRGGDR